jgi:hypothetical protein
MNLRFHKDSAKVKSPINGIATSLALPKMAPFDTLAAFIKMSFFIAGGRDSTSSLSLESNAIYLNKMMAELYDVPLIKFTDNSHFEHDHRCYEQIIYESHKVPTRPNWHDFFNGLIWTQFPKTKHYFNKIHMQQIALTGNAKKRTSERDRLTHFDECGLVLFTNCAEVQGQLKEHDWKSLFQDNANKWHSRIFPVIFGHALWEMLLDPFIGLTAKVTVIEVSDQLLSKMTSLDSGKVLFAICDTLLREHITDKQLISAKKPWLPMPLLGIPNWSPFEQNTAFYNDTSYFMPKRK